MKQIGWDLKNGVIWPIHPVKGVKAIKHVKSIYFDISITKSIIINHFAYVTVLPPGGDGAKEVIAFKRENMIHICQNLAILFYEWKIRKIFSGKAYVV